MIRTGHVLYETEMKKGLLELNSSLAFPSGIKADRSFDHPQIDTKQGIFFNTKHICSMGRGSVPEYNIWSIRRNSVSGTPYKSNIMFVGWRHTFAALVEARIPGITWDTLCAKFDVPYKKPSGEPESTDADTNLVAEGVMI